MAAYLVVQLNDITDEALFAEFRAGMAAASPDISGNLIVQEGIIEVVEGDWAPQRLAVREFENIEKVKGWLASPEYAELREKRTRAASASVIIVEGR